jgi:molybdopterin-synthase adenylyltransferase
MDPVADRYSRQTRFAGIGEVGQRRLRESSVVIVGCGALGSVSAEMLVRAGIGRLTIVDRDFVEESNLQRQSLFTEAHAAQNLPKAAAARETLASINSEVEVRGLVVDLIPENVHDLCRDAGVVVDGTDNFETRYLINDWCVKERTPWVYGACLGAYGVSFVIRPALGPCLQCLFQSPPEAGSFETCDTAGIIAPIVHLVSAWQVTQTLKLLVGQDVSEQLLVADLWRDQLRTVPIRRDVDCACCQARRFEFLEGEGIGRSIRLCGRNAVQVSPGVESRVDFETVAQRLADTGIIRFNGYMMRIQVEGYDISLFPDGRSVIKGTEDPAEARSIYSKYIGS